MVRHYRRIGMFFACVVIGFFGFLQCSPITHQGNRETSLAQTAPCLVLHLEAMKDMQHVADAPILSATIENVGSRSAVLMMPGDGSYDGWRTPRIKWSLLSANAPQAKHTPPSLVRRFRQCGVLDPRRPGDIFTLASGEHRLVDSISVNDLPGKSGQYRIVFYYQNDPRGKTGIPGYAAPDVLEQVRQSTPCLLMSNELILTMKK